MTKSLPTLTLLLAALLVAAPVFGQNAPRTDCRRLLDEAAVFEKSQQYDRALKKYLSAKEECSAAADANVDSLILKVFDKIQKQKKDADDAKGAAVKIAKVAEAAQHAAEFAQAKAERSSKANQLAALALSKTNSDATLSLQLAAKAWQSSVDSASGLCTEPGVSAVLHDIASDPATWFYLPLKGHDGTVNSVAFSPDGNLLTTASDDKTVRFWNLAGEPTDTLLGHTGAVQSVAFSPDGERLLTYAADSTARIWNRKGEAVYVLRHGAGLNSAVLSPNGRWVLTACNDSTASLWDAQTGERLNTWKSGRGPVLSAAFSPDGRRILTLSDNRAPAPPNVPTTYSDDGPTAPYAYTPVPLDPRGSRVELWDSTGVFIDSLFRGSDVKKVLFDPLGRYIVALAITKQNQRVVYRASTANLAAVDTLRRNGVNDIAISADGWRVFLPQYGGEVKYAELADFTQIWDAGAASAGVHASTPRGEWAAFAGRSVTLWKGPGYQSVSLGGERGTAKCAAFSPTAPFLLTGGTDGRAYLWFEGCNWPYQNLGAAMGYGRVSTLFSPDQQKAAMWTERELWRLGFDKKSLKRLSVAETERVVFSPDGSLLAVTSRTDSLLRIVDGECKVLAQLSLPGPGPKDLGNSAHAPVHAMYFSPSNRRLAVWLPDGLLLYDLRNSKAQPLGASQNGMRFTAWSPDGIRLLTHKDTLAYLWDEQGVLLTTLRGHKSHIWEGQFLADGQHIITTSSSGYILWALGGQLLGKFSRPYFEGEEPPTTLDVAPGGKRFLWKNPAGGVELYNSAGQRTGQLKAVDDKSQNRDRELSFTPNGQYITANTWTDEGVATTFWSATGEYCFEVKGHLKQDGRFGPRTQGEFFPNGDFLTQMSKGGTVTFRRWDNRGQLVKIYEGYSGELTTASAAVSADGRFVMASDGQKAWVWNADGTLFRTIRSGPNGGTEFRFTNDNRFVVGHAYNQAPRMWAIGATFANECQVLGNADLLQSGAGVDIAEVLRSADPNEVAEMAGYYFDRSDWAHARPFYERLEQLRHSPDALQKLYTIGEKTGRPYPTAPFQKATAFDELVLHADFFYQKKKWATARDLYEKAEPMQPSARCLNQLCRLADTLRSIFDLSRYDRLDGNFKELQAAADYLRQRGKSPQKAQQLYEKALALQFDPYLLSNLYLMCRANAMLFDTLRFLATNDANQLSAGGNFFFRERKWEMARKLLEKSESIQHRTHVLMSLQTVADSMGQQFDFNRFLNTTDLDELQEYAIRFEEQQSNWERARLILERREAVQHNPDNLTNLYRLSLYYEQPFDFDRMLSSDKPAELKQYANYVGSVWGSANNRDRVPALQRAVQLSEKRLLLEPATPPAAVPPVEKPAVSLPVAYDAPVAYSTAPETAASTLAGYYNTLGFALLFVPSPVEAEAALLRAKALRPSPLAEYLPIALTMQGRFEEAKAMYLEQADKPYEYRTYRVAFLAALNELERQGVAHQDFEKVRRLLKK